MRRVVPLWGRHSAGSSTTDVQAGTCCRRCDDGVLSGVETAVFAEVTISSHRCHDFRRFEEAAARHPEIVECYKLSGGYDYLLKFVATSVARFQARMERLLQDDIGIEKFNSRIVLRQPFGRRACPLGLIAAAPSRP